ncbi:MAG TPA: DNA repair protein RadC [Deltaproteobacteria bacterium]|nr:DNA repair protein RadC [Deltaproteobacteria bacterium]
MSEGRNPNAGHRRRLRERFKKGGLRALHDYEVLELLLTYAIPRRDVKPLAKELIRRFKGFRGVLDAPIDELAAVRGMGENAALLATLVKECCALYLYDKVMGSTCVGTPKDLVDYLSVRLAGERNEKFLAVYLNTKNEIIEVETLHEGTLNETAVYPRTVVERAFKHNARSVIFVHNHPSGDPAPSRNDKLLTRSLERAAEGVGLAVLDHIIIGRNSFRSGKSEGWVGRRADPERRIAGVGEEE